MKLAAFIPAYASAAGIQAKNLTFTASALFENQIRKLGNTTIDTEKLLNDEATNVQSNFEKKYAWNIEMGRKNCPPTTDFNSETDQPLTYSGFYLEDEGVGSNTIDYAKVF